jgi:hypothetical protein
LKAVADMEVAKPTEPAKQVELADGWWELAKKEQGLSQRNLRSHSAEWYKKALPSLTGVLKLKAEIRLEEIERTAEDSSLWAVIFRSDDPSIWNTNVNEGKNRFAVALSRLPNNTRFVRIKQVATDKYIIIPIRKEQLGNKNTAPVRYRWNGSNEMLFGGNHLGVFDAEGGTAIGRIELAYGLTGWGFGHVAGPGGRAWGWAGANVNKSVFEIAIKTETLTATEGRFLLGPIVPPVRPKN